MTRKVKFGNLEVNAAELQEKALEAIAVVALVPNNQDSIPFFLSSISFSLVAISLQLEAINGKLTSSIKPGLHKA